MAKVFLDANIFIDLMEDRDPSLANRLDGSELLVSVLSIEIWAYIYKVPMPNSNLTDLSDTFNFIDYLSSTAKKSFLGPTSDFEDNVQLHSASDSGCTVFLTKDSKLLKLGYFGKVRICDTL